MLGHVCSRLFVIVGSDGPKFLSAEEMIYEQKLLADIKDRVASGKGEEYQLWRCEWQSGRGLKLGKRVRGVN